MYNEYRAVWNELTADGADFAIDTIEVRGHPMRIYKNAPGTVADVWAATAAFAERDYLVYEDERLTYADVHQRVTAIAAWLAAQGVEPGDRVEEHQAVVEVMTDKATVEVPAPRAGVISDFKASAGDVVPVGSVLFLLSDDGAGEDHGFCADLCAPGHDDMGFHLDSIVQDDIRSNDRKRADKCPGTDPSAFVHHG